jgi:dihydrolipoamide dehydrogenase
VEAEDRLLPAEDAWLAGLLARAFKARGIHVAAGARVEGAEAGRDGLALALSGAEPAEVACDRVLVAIGREPNLDGLGLETVGLAPEGGAIPVDGLGRTAVDGVFAIGDVTGPPLLAHRASRQGWIVAGVAAGRSPEPLDPALVPSCIYTHPQLASVGARPGADDVVGEAFFRANGLGVVTGRTEGGVRLVAEAGSGRLKGAQLAGAGVTEFVGLLGACLGAGLTVRDLARGVFPHPTLSESVHEAAEAAVRRLG